MNKSNSLTALEVVQTIQENKTEQNKALISDALKKGSIDKNSIFSIALTCAQNNRLQDALILFECLEDLSRSDSKYFYNLGLIHSLRGNHRKALESYDKALEIQPNDIEALVNKGAACNENKNYDLALVTLREAIKIDPNIPEIWSNKGIALSNLGFYQEALKAYDVAAKLNPQYLEAFSNKGITLSKLKRFDEALELFDRALTLNADYIEAWVGKGLALHGLKRFDEALDSYDRALNLRPNYQEVWNNKGTTLHLMQRSKEALICYEKAISLSPNYSEAYFNKGCTFNDLKQYEKAIASFDIALSIQPKDARLFYNKGLANIGINQYEEAASNLIQAIKCNYDPIEHAQYILSALKPENGLRPMPNDFVVGLFDQFADNFDKHLLGGLRYVSPQILYGLLVGRIRDNLNILDLGCGTGLMGTLLKPHASNIVGVDLSSEMLAKAKLTNCYNILIADDIQIYLRDCSEKFNLITCADVFIYVGDLQDTFKNCASILVDEGYYCFSVEKTENQSFELSPKTLRFSHSKNYIQNLASTHGFIVEEFQEDSIRQENGEDVVGYHFLLKKLPVS